MKKILKIVIQVVKYPLAFILPVVALGGSGSYSTKRASG